MRYDERYNLGRRVYWQEEDGHQMHGAIIGVALAPIFSSNIARGAPDRRGDTAAPAPHPENPLLCVSLDDGARRVVRGADIEVQPSAGPLREAALQANRDPFAGQ